MAVWWITLLCLGIIGPSAAENTQTVRATNIRAPVGGFTIPIKDDRLPDPNDNITLLNHLDSLLNAVIDIWIGENVSLPAHLAIPLLNDTARTNLNRTNKFNETEFDLYNSNLLSLASQSLQADIDFLLTNNCSGYLNVSEESALNAIPAQLFLPRCEPDDDYIDFTGSNNGSFIGNVSAVNQYMNDTFWDFTSEYIQAIYNTSVITKFYHYGALMGVGRTVPCSEQVNTVLESKDPWAQVGSNAATTLMALLPTFLAFGNLYVPRSSEVFSTSIFVGLGASLYSFGLPVTSLSAIPDDQRLDLATFGLATLAMIASFATMKDNKMKNKKLREPKEDPDKNKAPRLRDLQKWSDEPGKCNTSMDEAKSSFAEIKKAVVEECGDRWHWWYLPTIVVTTSQAVMFGLGIYHLLADIGAPRFIFTCYTNWTGRYLAISASVNAFFRLCMWEIGNHERVLVYSLSPRDSEGRRQLSAAERGLRKMLEENAKKGSVQIEGHAENLVNSEGKELPSMQNELPPLYPPLLSLIWASVDKYNPRIGAEKNWERYNVHLDQFDKTTNMRWIAKAYHIIKSSATRNYSHIKYETKYMWKNILTGQILKIGLKDESAKARRHKPLVILIHLSTEGRNIFMTLLTGFIEAALLLLLTFFMASQWGGNLVITLFALTILLMFVTVGRALSLIYVRLTCTIWGLHSINCNSQKEILGSLRIICCTKEVLVYVNGAIYYDGYRLNGLDGFREWQDDYDAGKFDRDVSDFDVDSGVSASDGFDGKFDGKFDKGGKKKKNTHIKRKSLMKSDEDIELGVVYELAGRVNSQVEIENGSYGGDGKGRHRKGFERKVTTDGAESRYQLLNPSFEEVDIAADRVDGCEDVRFVGSRSVLHSDSD